MLGLFRLHRRNTLAAVCVLVVLSPGVVLAQSTDKGKDKVKSEAGYHPTGQPMDATALARFVDTTIDQKLRAEQVDASPLADDAEFMRRVTLDLTGHIPTAEKVIAFLESKDPQKRAQLIDSLLASEEFGKHEADIWQALLLPPRNSDNRQLNTAPLVKWLEESFNANKPWDRLATDLLTASGEQDKNGATTYFLAQNSVDKITDNVSRVFLGVQLQCAQCHNHPFTEWKQTEYWGMAAFFLNVQASRPMAAAQQTTPLEVKEVAGMRRGGRNRLPDSAKIVPPKFLGAEQPKIRSSDPLRPVLTSWLTTKENPYFSRAMVNRTWAQLFGRGLVNPVDDIQDNNQPLYPELFGELSYQFAQNGYDLKYLMRALCNSAAYQRTSKPAGNNADAPPALFSRMAIKVMSPEQLYDSLTLVLGNLNTGGGGGRFGMGMGRGAGGGGRAQFVAFFGNEDGMDPTEYQSGIPQALRLMNGPSLSNPTRIAEIVRAGKTPEGTIERLYLMTLSRRPTTREVERYTAFVKEQPIANKAYADLLWVLLNSSAFAMNH